MSYILKLTHLVNTKGIANKCCNFKRSFASQHARSIVSGVYPPIPTIFREDGSLDIDAISNNVTKLLTENPKIKGLLVFGSNGEYPHVTSDEKAQIFKAVKKATENAFQSLSNSKKVEHEFTLLAGTGMNGTRDTIELTKKAADFGYDAAMVITPYYYKPQMTDEAYVRHYETVATSSSIPIILYNVPLFTGVDMSVSAISRIAPHSNVIGIKESSGLIVKMSELVEIGTKKEKLGGTFGVFAGSGRFQCFVTKIDSKSYFLPALTIGARGGVMALANILPNECVTLYELVQSKQFEKAQKLQAAIIALNNAVTRGFGVPGLKAAMPYFGFEGGFPRAPLLRLERSQTDQLLRIIDQTHDNLRNIK